MSEPTASKAGGLSARHINFFALGGAIGTGLFLGSGNAIATTGPSVVLTYFLCGLAIFIMCRSVGEMVLEHPDTGAFSSYARRYLGALPGFSLGWSYAILMLIIALAEIGAIPIYMAFWYPDVPSWIWVLVTIIGMGLLNAAPVRIFGETEFAMTLVLVTTVILLLIGGLGLAIFGLGIHDPATNIPNLVGNGGLFPNGIVGFATSFAVVLFAFGGTEAIGLTAAEADDPNTAIPSAVNQVPWRIALFYIGLIALTVVIQPWNTVTEDASPFVQSMTDLGLTWAAGVFNVVILLAALSTINAVLFASGRMIAGLADDGLASAALARRNSRGVPVVSVWALVTVMIVAFVWHLISQVPLFLPAATLAACTAVVCWILIVLSQIIGRKRYTKAPRFPAPFFPYAQYLALAFFVLMLVLIAVTRPSAFAMSMGLQVVFAVVWYLRFRTSGPAIATPSSR
ncbi:amino acid permease [Stomatohabitans albus]|uniref:amino acid permease n=1 Tax=Stomatohabitans albus TaxID=3110766 RepID=UPI00300D2213